MTNTTKAEKDALALLPLLGWFTGALFFFYAWVLRVAPSVMVDELMRDFSVGAGVLGNLSAAYFYGYAGMQIPVGLMLDRFGPRRLMSVAAALCGCGCILFATGESLATVTAGRFLIGASAAFSLVGAMAVAGQWFQANRFALLSGLAMAMGMAGGVFGQAPLRIAVEASDWRTTMFALGAGGFAIGIMAWATVRDKRRGQGGLAQVLSGLRTVARDRQTWLIAICGLGSTAPLLGFAGLWGVPFLGTAYGLERTEAAAITSLMIAGWGVGAPLFGWWSDRIGRRCMPLLLGVAAETLTLGLLIFLPALPIPVLATLSFAVGLFGASQIACFGLIREIHPPSLSGTAIGMVNGMVTGAGALFQPLIGVLLDLAWSGRIIAGVRIYEAADYRMALAVLVVFSGIAALCVIPIRETNCRPVSDDA